MTWVGKDAARDVGELLRPYPSKELRAYRVSTAVNSVRNDGPECVVAVKARIMRDDSDAGETVSTRDFLASIIADLERLAGNA